MAASVLQDSGSLNLNPFFSTTGANAVAIVTQDATQMLTFDGTAKTITVASGVTMS